MTATVPPLVVVLLCIIGAGALVTAFAAFGKSMFGREQQEPNSFQRSPEQDSYLQRVREMNRVAIWGSARAQRREERRQRDIDASDIEIQTNRSYSNVDGPTGGYASRNGVHQNYARGHTPVAYYEEDYAPHDEAGYYEQPQQHQQQQYQQQYPQQRPYNGGHNNPYYNSQAKAGPTETWNEVPR